MNNYQLELYLKKYHVKVVCADKLPIFMKHSKYRFWVVNTDKCGGRGLHWVTFYFPETGPAEFFDSLGKPPEYYHNRFKYILTLNAPRYKYACSSLQSETSSVCGHYCVYYVLQRIKKRSMNNIVNDFNVLELHANDQLVYDFVRNLNK